MSHETQILIGVAQADLILSNPWFYVICAISIVLSVACIAYLIKTWR